MTYMKTIEELLITDSTTISKIYGFYRDGKTPKEAANTLGHKNALYTTINYFTIDALLGKRSVLELKGDSKRFFYGFLKRHSTEITEELADWLLDSQLDPDRGPGLPSPPIKNVNMTIPKNNDQPGVYVYSYPTFLSTAAFKGEAPLLKIGMSASSIERRIGRQTSQTEVPEPIELLWSIPCDNPLLLEKKIHKILKMFGYWRKSTGAGSEWFQIDLEQVKELAKVLNS